MIIGTLQVHRSAVIRGGGLAPLGASGTAGSCEGDQGCDGSMRDGRVELFGSRAAPGGDGLPTPRIGSAAVPPTGRSLPQPGSDPALDVDEYE